MCAMEQERAQTPKRIKTYSDSTMRLVRETALTGNVDAMSGGTTGNILNAVDIDTKAREARGSQEGCSSSTALPRFLPFTRRLAVSNSPLSATLVLAAGNRSDYTFDYVFFQLHQQVVGDGEKLRA